MVVNTAQMERGDLLEIRRGLYSHWAVYAGNGKIFHLTFNLSECDGIIGIFKRLLSKSIVRCEKLDDVAGTSDVIVNNSLDGQVKPKMGEDTIKIAETCEQEGGYSILFGNCETFANMCRYGHPISFQAVYLVKILFALDAGIAVGKMTKRFLEDKIGCIGATIAGAATACGTLYLLMNLSLVHELVISLVLYASKKVLLTVGCWTAASNIFLVLDIGYKCYAVCKIVYQVSQVVYQVVYQVVNRETVQTISSWLCESFNDFHSGLYSLVTRTVSRLMSAPQ